eukprot:Nk52_evm9s172 gene=Nk52_evmTU9s172
MDNLPQSSPSNEDSKLEMLLVITTDEIPPATTTTASNQRLEYLDGLRGMACLIVVIFHWILVIDARAMVAGWDYWGEYTPLYILRNGPFSVFVFFVLSGFVLSLPIVKGIKNGREASSPEAFKDVLIKIASQAVARVPRLCIPAIASYYLAYLQFATGLASLNPNNAQQYFQLIQTPSVYEALYQPFYSIWAEFYAPEINGVLWTISIEFWGSYFVFVMAIVFACIDKRARIVVVGASLYLTAYQKFIYFMPGVLLAVWKSEGYIDNILKKVSESGTITKVFLCIAFGLTFYASRYDFNFVPQPLIQYYQCAWAFLAVFLVLVTPPLIAFFSTRFMHFLGEISFSIYLVHYPLIYSFVKPLIGGVFYPLTNSWGAATWLTLPIYVAVSIAFGFAFHWALEKRIPPLARKCGIWATSAIRSEQ